MQNLKVNINGPHDLRGRAVGVVRGTTSQEYMQKEPAHIETFDRVEDALFESQDYGMALPEGSPLREKINRALLGLIESDELEAISKKWFGDESGK